ncbi:MAG: cytidine deaminase [Prevotella sp.]|jgi:cytidine deaminase|nr:cytidine deaminase [Prevotella sp.]
METIQLKQDLLFCQLEELSNDEQQLVRKAMQATDNSYSPYSKFRVGAALRLADGTEIIGANQENAAFPVTLCAERTAIFAAQAQYPAQPIVALAVAARNENGFTEDPVTPCGSCRQVILEIEQRYNQSVKIYLYGTRGVYVINTVRDLLPLCFVEESMG